MSRWPSLWADLARAGRLMVGMPDYAHYVARRAVHHPGAPVMTRAEFHRERTERRFGGVSRCC